MKVPKTIPPPFQHDINGISGQSEKKIPNHQHDVQNSIDTFGVRFNHGPNEVKEDRFSTLGNHVTSRKLEKKDRIAHPSASYDEEKKKHGFEFIVERDK